MNTTAEPPVFITGATGLIGSHVARRCLADGRRVSALKRPDSDYGLLADVADQLSWHEGDVLDIPSLEAAIEPGSDVVHAAALVNFLPRDRALMEKVNVDGTANVVNACLRAGVRKLAYVSSVVALSRPARTPATDRQSQLDPIFINEDQKWEESPYNSAYGKAKHRAELEVWRGTAEGLPAVIVNPTIVLGVGQWGRSSLQIVEYLAQERRYYMGGLVNLVDVLDVADALVQLLASPIQNKRFILNGGTIPYKDLFEQLAEAMQTRPPYIRVSRLVSQIIWPIESLVARLTGRKPLVTRDASVTASLLYSYDGRRIRQAIGFQYRPLGETLKRVGQAWRMSRNSR
ncbi:NAD-dependent epimerase/dehydratase family protein [Spirosoma luteolum]